MIEKYLALADRMDEMARRLEVEAEGLKPSDAKFLKDKAALIRAGAARTREEVDEALEVDPRAP